MRYRCHIICFFCLVILSVFPVWAVSDSPASGEIVPAAGEVKTSDADYMIGPGDQLDISVWKDEALTKIVLVLPDGKIYFPLIGEVTAGGKTISQLKKDMETRLASYVNDVVLNVDVRQVNSLLIYVIGRVNNPGRLVLNSNVNVLQALSSAGGLNPFARRSQIKIFRRDVQETKVFKFDYDDVSSGKHLEQNILLKRGDVIVVP